MAAHKIRKKKRGRAKRYFGRYTFMELVLAGLGLAIILIALLLIAAAVVGE